MIHDMIEKQRQVLADSINQNGIDHQRTILESEILDKLILDVQDWGDSYKSKQD